VIAPERHFDGGAMATFAAPFGRSRRRMRGGESATIVLSPARAARRLTALI